MRRKVILVIIFSVAVFLTACGNKNSEEDKNEDKQMSIDGIVR